MVLKMVKTSRQVPTERGDAMNTVVIAKSNKTVFESIKYVARAMNVDDCRAFMNGILIEEVNENEVLAVATDGKRLHTAMIVGKIEPGFYHVKANAKDIVLISVEGENKPEYPKWRRVVPEDGAVEKVSVVGTKDRMVDGEGDGTNQAAFDVFSRGIYVKLNYLEDAVKGDEFECYISREDVKESGVMFKNHNKMAVVMPVRR